MSLIDQYRQMHENYKRFRGHLHTRYLPTIADLVARHGADTLLDYGSGKGMQYVEHRQHESWGGILPLCYDPGYLPYSARPAQRFCGVICTGVAEHIPREDVGAFLDDVLGYARRFAFLQIGVATSRKLLPDGRSVHLTVEPPAWWRAQIEPRRGDLEVVVDFTSEGNLSVTES